jgi:hypothetical protein
MRKVKALPPYKKPLRLSQFSDCRTCPHRKDIDYCKNFCKKGGINNEIRD